MLDVRSVGWWAVSVCVLCMISNNYCIPFWSLSSPYCALLGVYMHLHINIGFILCPSKLFCILRWKRVCIKRVTCSIGKSRKVISNETIWINKFTNGYLRCNRTINYEISLYKSHQRLSLLIQNPSLWSLRIVTIIADDFLVQKIHQRWSLHI